MKNVGDQKTVASAALPSSTPDNEILRERSLSLETTEEEDEDSVEDDPDTMLSLLSGSAQTLMMTNAFDPTSSVLTDTNTTTTSIFSSSNSALLGTENSAMTTSLPKFEELAAGLPGLTTSTTTSTTVTPQEPFTIVNVAMPEHANISDLSLSGQMLYLVPQQDQLSCSGMSSNYGGGGANPGQVVGPSQSQVQQQQQQQQQQFNFQYSAVPPNFDSLLQFSGDQLQPHSIIVPQPTCESQSIYQTADFLGGNQQFMYTTTTPQQQQHQQLQQDYSFGNQGQQQQQMNYQIPEQQGVNVDNTAAVPNLHQDPMQFN